MRVHLLSLPNVQTTMEYDLDGFNVMTIKFAKILKRLGAYVMLYASEENEAPCDELITITTKAEQKEIVGPFAYQHANISFENPLWQLANPRMIAEIGKRKQPRDYICTIGGGSQQPVTNAHPELMTVEYSIGYVGNYAKYRVFESEAWRHLCYGWQKFDEVRNFDAVIPCFFEEDDFPSTAGPHDYLCYVGRYVNRKGVSVVCDIARRAGLPLKLVGHGDPRLITYGEDLGALPYAQRNEVMAGARALLCPTYYIEPFGCIAPEAQLCGTPVIATDAGGFVETVKHGITGFRCNLLGEFVDAVEKVRHLDRSTIRQIARQEYGMDAAEAAYRKYFARLDTLWDKGWDTVPYEVAV